MTSARRSFNVIGVGAAACVACCAVPIAGFIAATGLLTASSVAVFGAVGLLVAIPGVVVVARRPARRSSCEVTAVDHQPVTVPTPSRRS